MTRLRIIHDTIYRYAKPVHFGPHRLVLRPREGHDVNVVTMELTAEPQSEVLWSRDVFGNSVAALAPTLPSDVLHIRSSVLLDRSANADAPIAQVRDRDYPVDYPPLEAAMAAAYIDPAFPDEEGVVRGFVFETLGLEPRGNVGAVLPRLNTAIHRRISYRRREQKGVQLPSQTVTLATGSCRDLATLFMESARALGVAARFVSGYLDCPASEAGRAATHAWAEVYLPDNGWCGFDPTLGETTSHKHVVVGVSNHPRGVMPISGSYTGSAADYLGLEVAVQIRQVDDPSAAST